MSAGVPLQAPTDHRRGCRHRYLHTNNLAYEPVLCEPDISYKRAGLGMFWSLLSPVSPSMPCRSCFTPSLIG
ncbi:hypothetical protein ACVWYJ_000569 [Bradyrhizobium sp. USDA 4471]